MIYYNKPNIKSAIIRFSLVICVLFAPAYHAFAKHKYNNHITGKTQNRTVQEAPFNPDSTEQQYDASFLSFRAPDKLVDKILEYAKKQKENPTEEEVKDRTDSIVRVSPNMFTDTSTIT